MAGRLNGQLVSCGITLLLVGTVFAADPATVADRIPADDLPQGLSTRELPAGLEKPPVSRDNPVTAAKVKLGRRLFFDPLLSENRTLACASCHDPRRGFADPRPVSTGVNDTRGKRNAPSLFNVAYGKRFFWDGRAMSLEDQVRFPIENPAELGNKLPVVVARLKQKTDYVSQFRDAFGEGVTGWNVARAIASFERTLLLGNSAVDRFRGGKAASLSDDQRQGLWLFESRGRCWRCHSGKNFSDEGFHNTGVGSERAMPDPGRQGISRRPADRGAFKTPTLRGVSRTAPYMHDGSIKTLRQVVEFYNKGGRRNENLDPLMQPLKLSDRELGFLVEFLKALDGDWPGRAPVGKKSR